MCRTASKAPPEELSALQGRFFKHSAEELFSEESWVQVLIGQGLAHGTDPVTDFVPDGDLSGIHERH